MKIIKFQNSILHVKLKLEHVITEIALHVSSLSSRAEQCTITGILKFCPNIKTYFCLLTQQKSDQMIKTVIQKLRFTNFSQRIIFIGVLNPISVNKNDKSPGNF